MDRLSETIKLLKCLVSRAQELLVGGEGIGKFGRATKQFLQDLASIGLGQRLKRFQQVPRRVFHMQPLYAGPVSAALGPSASPGFREHLASRNDVVRITLVFGQTLVDYGAMDYAQDEACYHALAKKLGREVRTVGPRKRVAIDRKVLEPLNVSKRAEDGPLELSGEIYSPAAPSLNFSHTT